MSGIPKQIRLTREQIDFIKYMLEEDNSKKAAEKFAMIMIEEGLTVEECGEYLDKIIIAWSKSK